jgi:hypothetical protein
MTLYMANSFQLTRTPKLLLAHQELTEETEVNTQRCFASRWSLSPLLPHLPFDRALESLSADVWRNDRFPGQYVK